MPLTQRDLDRIEQLIDRKLEEKLDQKFDERMKYLPTKDEFYKAVDKIMGELQAIREEKVKLLAN